jgi:hypothetical protein
MQLLSESLLNKIYLSRYISLQARSHDEGLEYTIDSNHVWKMAQGVVVEGLQLNEVYNTLKKPSPILKSHITSLEKFIKLNSESKSRIIIDLSSLNDLANDLNACLRQDKLADMHENSQKNFIRAKTNWDQKDLIKKKGKKTLNEDVNNKGIYNICSNNRILEKFQSIPQSYTEHFPIEYK